MQYRTLGKSGLQISDVSFGAWALGGDFGTVDDSESRQALEKAVELGVNFFDTADVYGDGRSERVLGEFRRSTNTPIVIATKLGRRLSPHRARGYTLENLTGFVERSLKNLGVDRLDLVQLHCPPTDVYYMPEVFDIMSKLKQEGRIAHYGVSVERVEEGLKALEYPEVTSVQVVYNLLRQRPHELFFEQATRRNVGVLARLPLSSGLLAGKMKRTSTFEASDHRSYNRHGQAFDRGETFSGVDFELGLDFVDAIRPLVPSSSTMAAFAMRWILRQPAVTAVIPGAKRPEQVAENVRASDASRFEAETLDQLEALYREHIRPQVHHKW